MTAKTVKTAKAAPKRKAVSLPVARKVGAAKPAMKLVLTNEVVAQRAYFIGERRTGLGLPGDSLGDWLEAERQLRAESGAK